MTDITSHEVFVTVWMEVLDIYPRMPTEALLEWAEKSIRMWAGCRGVLRRINHPDARALASICTRFMRLHQKQFHLYQEIVILKARNDPEGSKNWNKTTRTINCKVEKHKKFIHEMDWLGNESLAITGISVEEN